MTDQERAREFARRLFGVDHLGQVNLRENAEWRHFLDAIDYAIESHPDTGREFSVEIGGES